MINSFYGKLILKSDNFLYIQNVYGCKEIYVKNPNEYNVGNEYFFYYFSYKLISNKSIEFVYNIGYQNLVDVIAFKNLISINGIGLKTALKIIEVGIYKLKELAINNQKYEIIDQFCINKSIVEKIIDFYCSKENKNLPINELKKINIAISNLKILGYKHDIVSKVVWNKKDEVISKSFNEIFPTLIHDLKNERCKS